MRLICVVYLHILYTSLIMPSTNVYTIYYVPVYMYTHIVYQEAHREPDRARLLGQRQGRQPLLQLPCLILYTCYYMYRLDVFDVHVSSSVVSAVLYDISMSMILAVYDVCIRYNQCVIMYTCVLVAYDVWICTCYKYA